MDLTIAAARILKRARTQVLRERLGVFGRLRRGRNRKQEHRNRVVRQHAAGEADGEGIGVPAEGTFPASRRVVPEHLGRAPQVGRASWYTFRIASIISFMIQV